MIKNALTFDLEDWHHIELLQKHVPNLRLNNLHAPVENIISILDNYKIKATFFVVGEFAQAYPLLIEKLYSDGHEIACHTVSHKSLVRLSPDELRDDLTTFKEIITNILGHFPVKGFRAPSFSLNYRSKWALDILEEFNFSYDASILPSYPILYGVPQAPNAIYNICSSDICHHTPSARLKEFPATVIKKGILRLPIGGGIYLRLLPVKLQAFFLRHINKTAPFMVYVHPWECVKIPTVIRGPRIARALTCINQKSMLSKILYLLDNFAFDRVDNILETHQ